MVWFSLVWSFAEHHCVLLAELLLETVPPSLYDISFQDLLTLCLLRRGLPSFDYFLFIYLFLFYFIFGLLPVCVFSSSALAFALLVVFLSCLPLAFCFYRPVLARCILLGVPKTSARRPLHVCVRFLCFSGLCAFLTLLPIVIAVAHVCW